MPRTKTGLTFRELTVLEFIKRYHKARGYAPSLREICEELGFGSTSLVHFYISNLVDAGKLKKDPAIARGIVVVEGA